MRCVVRASVGWLASPQYIHILVCTARCFLLSWRVVPRYDGQFRTWRSGYRAFCSLLPGVCEIAKISVIAGGVSAIPEARAKRLPNGEGMTRTERVEVENVQRGPPPFAPSCSRVLRCGGTIKKRFLLFL